MLRHLNLDTLTTHVYDTVSELADMVDGLNPLLNLLEVLDSDGDWLPLVDLELTDTTRPMLAPFVTEAD